MYPTQSITLDTKSTEKLKTLYQNGENHSVRQKGHAILMRNYNFSVNDIALSLRLSKEVVVFQIKAYFHFGLDGLLNSESIDIRNRIIELEVEEPNEPLIDWTKVLEWINRTINFFSKSIKNALASLLGVCLFFIAFIGSQLKLINTKKFHYKPKTTTNNLVDIGKNSKNNLVFITTNINHNVDGELVSTVKKKEEAKTQKEAQDLIKDMFNSDKEIVTNSRVVSLFFAINERLQRIEDKGNEIDKNQNKKKYKQYVIFLAGILAWYLWNYAQIKGSILLISFLGLTTISINFNSILNYFNTNKKDLIVAEDVIDTVKTIQPVPIDSLSISNNDSLVNNETTEDSLNLTEMQIEDFFEPFNNCDLTDIKGKQRKFINNDIKRHYLEDYYVRRQDDKYYLHVAAYITEQEAAFQREYLKLQGYDNCKIIPLRSGMYAVTIGDFENSEILNLCELKSDWDLFCDKTDSKAELYHNY